MIIIGINNQSFNAKFKMKKRAYSDQEVSSNKLLSAETQQDSVPEEEQEDIKVSSFLFLKIAVFASTYLQVGTFLVLKSESSCSTPNLWRVDGKTLIQKYECTDGVGVKYKNVNTYSGWTSASR